MNVFEFNDNSFFINYIIINNYIKLKFSIFCKIMNVYLYFNKHFKATMNIIFNCVLNNFYVG